MTKNQIRTFWPAFAAACREQGLSGAVEKDAYRRRVMMEEANAEHLADVSEGVGYERVMARIKADAGDLVGAVEYATAGDRRLVAMVEDCARQVLELSAAACTPTAYIEGILAQSGLDPYAETSPRALLDYPEPTLRKLFIMLDTRRRSLQRAWMVANCKRLSMSFKFGRKWLEA